MSEIYINREYLTTLCLYALEEGKSEEAHKIYQ
jgi:hypothetical protein